MKSNDDRAWLKEPLFTAVDQINGSAFYRWLAGIASARDFAPVAKQIFFHSANFPKALGLMMGNTVIRDGHTFPILAQHAIEEADHHLLLIDWMLREGIIQRKDEAFETVQTLETEAAIAYGYKLATERDFEKWIVFMNIATERCALEFFKRTAPRMHALGAGHHYFDVHVGADEQHSIMGLDFISHDASPRRRAELIQTGLLAIRLWDEMIHSWIPAAEFTSA